MELVLPDQLQKCSGGVRHTPATDGRSGFVWISPGRQLYLDSFLRCMIKLECQKAALLAESTGGVKKNEVLKVLDTYGIEESEFRLDAILRWLTRQKKKAKV